MRFFRPTENVMDTKLHETPPAVVILGGSGFVGSHLVTALLDRGCRVAIVSRTPQGQHPIQAGVQWLPFKPDHFSELFKGYCALVNLIGILNEPTHNGRTFEQVHVDLVMQALDAARQAGIGRYLHMSALGADEHKGTSYYQRSKGRAENRVHAYGREHGIQVTSFRPSVIFGPGDSFLNRFAQLARLMPGFFPLACPDARFAPVCVTDVARVMADALNDPATYDQHIDLCGPADYSLRDDGKIRVVNTCRKPDGKITDATGRAKIVDPATNAKLKVTMACPVYGRGLRWLPHHSSNTLNPVAIAPTRWPSTM